MSPEFVAIILLVTIALVVLVSRRPELAHVPDAPRSVLELRRSLRRIETGETRDLGLLVQRVCQDADGDGWFDERGSDAIDQLLSFCRAIPLVGLQ